ncbi:MAG: ABC transporter permease [Nocardioides sp.]|uniref:ABC transporter permease n=1 Tax=Nocardioides sp. TaxID=35761 RepID=UPI003F0DE579
MSTTASTLTYAALDLRRQLRDKAGMFFIVVLPVFMYLVFGTGGSERVGSGNVAMYVTISMAAYGAVTATTTISGSAAAEQQLGWGRQIALTPLRPVRFVMVKAGVALTVAAVPIALIYLVGALTGARGSTSDWVVSAVLVWVGSTVFAIYGLAVSLLFPGPNSVSIASGAVVVLSFLGNVFIPLSGTVLDIARFTPMYGYAALARFPLTEGHLVTGGQDPLWLPITSVIVWTGVFTALAVWGMRRSKERR